MKRLFHRIVLTRVWLTFIVLGVSFFVFGVGTLNLGLLFMANARFLAGQGWQAVMDGALRQLAELVLTGYISMAAYVVFKACEYRLTHWLGDLPAPPVIVPQSPKKSTHENRSPTR